MSKKNDANQEKFIVRKSIEDYQKTEEKIQLILAELSSQIPITTLWSEGLQKCMNILITGKNLKRLNRMKSLLEKNGYTVFSTRSILNALETIRNFSIEAIICDYEIQIGTPINFPNWIIDEVGSLPPFFVLLGKSTKKEALKYKKSDMIAGVYRKINEIKNIKEVVAVIQKNIFES